MKRSPADALIRPLIRGGVKAVTIHGTTQLPGGGESQAMTVKLADGTSLGIEVQFEEDE